MQLEKETEVYIIALEKVIIPHNLTVDGYYGFMLVLHVSVHPSVIHPLIFLFPDYNLSGCQWIFTKLGMCIDIMEIRFDIANGQNFINVFTELSTCDTSIFLFSDIILSKISTGFHQTW